MPLEYKMLVLMTFFYLFAFVPLSIAKGQTFGIKWLASNRDQIPCELPAWGGRAERAYNNLKDYFPGFIVAILLLGMLNKFDQATSQAAVAYVLGRVGHYISYILGNFPARFVTYCVAMASNVFLLVKILL